MFPVIVVGLELDNLLVDKKGKVWRIDNGAGLRFRAQGAPKRDAFNEWNTELWTLRDPTKNRSAAQVFGDIEWEEIEGQMGAVLKKRDEILGLIEDAQLRSTMAARLDNMEEVFELSKDMTQDAWKGSYVDTFSKQRAMMGQSGMRATMPEELNPKMFRKEWSKSQMNLTNREVLDSTAPTVRDENGKLWDKLRDEDGIMLRYFDHLDTIAEGNKDLSAELAQLHNKWARSQAQDSWNGKPMAIKSWIHGNRDTAEDVVWWKGGKETSDRELKKFVEKEIPDPKKFGVNKTKRQLFDETFTSFHAMNYDILKKAKIPTKSLDNRSMTVVRTENSRVLRQYDMNKLGKVGSITRGQAESASMFQSFYYQGDSTVWTEVPLHRIFGSYLPSNGKFAYKRKYNRDPNAFGGGNRMFAGDGENEIVVIFDGLENQVMGLKMKSLGNKLKDGQYELGGVAPKKATKKAPKKPKALKEVEVDWSNIKINGSSLLDLAASSGVDLQKVKIKNPKLLEAIDSGLDLVEVIDDYLSENPWLPNPPFYIPKDLWKPNDGWANFKLMAEFDPKEVKKGKAAAPVKAAKATTTKKATTAKKKNVLKSWPKGAEMVKTKASGLSMYDVMVYPDVGKIGTFFKSGGKWVFEPSGPGESFSGSTLKSMTASLKKQKWVLEILSETKDWS